MGLFRVYQYALTEREKGVHMVPSQILQSTITGLKSIAHIELCVMDTEGNPVCTTSTELEKCRGDVIDFASSAADTQEVRGFMFFKIYDDKTPEYVLVSTGEGDEARMAAKMAAFQLQGLQGAYKERFDKDNFIKNLLLDNLLLVDIYSRAKKLHIRPDARRLAIIVETEANKDSNTLELLRMYMGANTLDFVTAVDEGNVVVVKDVTEGESAKDIKEITDGMIGYLEKEGQSHVRIAYGSVVSEIKEVSRSYKEAKMAMDVGKIFFDDRKCIAYAELGIGRLIYQLPIPLCKMFIREIFDGSSPDDLDEETVMTINKFFENSLNVSETSRQLFIHRNTLVYRLDKLQKTTNLDIRIFEDAITFKIALMVVKYMNYMEKYEF